ncbi:MAG: Ig-like domain-containing protein, partial [Pseudomonadota bacterium]
SVNGTMLTFNPGADFQDLSDGETRDVTVTIEAEDTQGATVQNDVTVTVTGVNDDPTLAAGMMSATEDGVAQQLDLSTLGDDIDSEDDGTTLMYSVDGQPSEGSASVNGTMLTFNPGADFQDLSDGETRDVTVTIEAEDTQGATVQNDVTVTVTGVNDAPDITTTLLSYSIPENTSAVAAFAADDPDTNDTLTFLIGGGADAALFQIDGATGALSFIAPPDFETPQDQGADNVYDVDVSVSDGTLTDTESVQVTVTDVVESAVATVSIGVLPTSRAEGDSGQQSVTFSVTRSGSTAQAVTVQVAAAGTAAAGTDFAGAIPTSVTLDPGESATTFTIQVNGDTTPESDETVEVTISTPNRGDHDIGVASATHTILNDDNTAPTAADDGPYTIDEDAGGTTGNVLANDLDPDTGDTLSVIGFDTTTGLGATVTSNGDGTFDIVPGATYDSLADGQTVSDDFEYTVSDGNGGTDTATASLTINGVNDNPMAVDDSASTTNQDPVEIDALANDTDVDNAQNTLFISSLSVNPSQGSAILLQNGNVEFTAAAGFSGIATVDYVVEDPDGGQDTGQISIDVQQVSNDPTNTAPTAVDDTDSVTEDGTTNGNILDNDTDNENDLLTLLSIGAPALGNLQITNAGAYTFDTNGDFDDLNQGESTTILIAYEVTDQQLSDDGELEITVNGVNDDPTLAAGAMSATEDGMVEELNLSTLGDDIDSEDDGTTLMYSVDGQPSEGSASVTGTTLSFDPGADFQDLGEGETREVTVTIEAEDLQGATVQNDVTVTVTGVNDAPVLGNTGPFDIPENDTRVAMISATDAENDTLTFDVIGGADGGLFSIDGPSGALRFIAAPDFENPLDADTDNVYEVLVEVTDGNLQDEQLILVTVTDLNEGLVYNPISGTAGNDLSLEGTSDPDIIDSMGGRYDIISGLAGGDIFDFSRTTSNGLREIREITDFNEAEGDMIDIGSATIATVRVVGNNTYLYLDTDRDIIVLEGVTSFDNDSLL